MPEKSLIQYAYDVLKESKEPVAFADLFAAVCEKAGLGELELDEKKVIISRFYTSLTVDGNFICRPNNSWDLCYRYSDKARHPKELEEAYTDDDYDDVSEEDADPEDFTALRSSSLEDSEEESSSDTDYDKNNTTIDESYLS